VRLNIASSQLHRPAGAVDQQILSNRNRAVIARLLVSVRSTSARQSADKTRRRQSEKSRAAKYYATPPGIYGTISLRHFKLASLQ
jgi:hypothetical protein